MANKSKYTLQEVTSPQLAREFLNLPKRIYKGNRNWVCPLDEDIEKVFDPARNPLFGDGEAIRWLVRNRKNEVVGRIAAFYNREQAAIEEQPTGGCGFFEAINDQEGADLLFDAARMWLATSARATRGGDCSSKATNSSPSTPTPTIRPTTRSCSNITGSATTSTRTPTSGA